MSKKNYVTQDELIELKEKLNDLINIDLPKNSEDIAAAIAQGDLSENAEYEIAKEEQANLNKEIVKIKNSIANAVLIRENNNNDYVEIGHKVTIKSLDDNKEETFTLLGSGDGKTTIEADCPLGTALLGKRVGDILTVDALIGELKYELLAIE